MKNNQHMTPHAAIGSRMNASAHPSKASKTKSTTGSVTGMYPVILDGGRTIIYTSDKTREGEIRLKYASRIDHDRSLQQER
jgi:hypothetical protein